MIKYHELNDKQWFLKDSSLFCENNGELEEVKNSDKLNLLNPQDMCIGVVGDGCGGGRIFIADSGNGMIKVYEPESGEIIVLLEDIFGVKTISKKGCTLFITTGSDTEMIEFDLPTMTKSVKRI